jgi:16S rRNA (adenine1518-N6/adenine1519-N6)-dimethyltransferase
VRLSEIRRILADGRIQLTKSLGQNFLHDGNQLRRIVAAAELTRADKVLEIGPGLGPLTERLVAEVGAVLAIEKDKRLFDYLCERFHARAASISTNRPTPLPCPGGEGEGENSPNQDFAPATLEAGPGHSESTFQDGGPLSRPPEERMPTGAAPGKDWPISGLHLVHADALEYLRKVPQDWGSWKLVSNLPYSVASTLLVELAQAPAPPQRLVVTLQLEVARRLVARAGEPDYGVLTLLIQRCYRPMSWFKIPASCFFPEPAVDSACAILERRPRPLLEGAAAESYHQIVKRAFSQRRKMMCKLLKVDWPVALLERACGQVLIPLHARAETVRLEQFVQLTRLLREDGALPSEGPDGQPPEASVSLS